MSGGDVVNVVALAGGVGGARMASGLESALGGGIWKGTTSESSLSVVVNTADDFELWGLYISPDLDTVMYTLAGISNREMGWGIQGETFGALGMLSEYGEDAWFLLGDRDIATHVLRSSLLRGGSSLTGVTSRLAGSLGVGSRMLPMTDDPVATILTTPDGELEFQEYFVRRRQQDEVLGVEFRGIRDARLTKEVSEAISAADVVVLCPSNPVVSIGPILAVPGMRDALADSSAVKVAVSPIIGGKALKGPADRMLLSMGHESSATGVARIYEGLVDGIVIDNVDSDEVEAVSGFGIEVLTTEAVMKDEADRERLGREVLEFAGSIRG